MALVATSAGNSNKEFPLVPEGPQQLAISEVKDLGMVPLNPVIVAKNKQQAQKEGKDPNKVKTESHQVRLRYVDAAGNSIIEQFTVSLHERSKLRPRVTQIIGKDPGDSFDLETLKGRQVQGIITHVERNGKKYANITAIFKAAPGQNVPLPSPKAAAPTGAATPDNPITDADLPWA